MPQLNQPFTYMGEYTQYSLFMALTLILLVFYILPSLMLKQAAAMVLSNETKSPLEQFAVPVLPHMGSASFGWSFLDAMWPNMVGLYGAWALTTMTLWYVSTLRTPLLVERNWAPFIVNVVQDTSRELLGHSLVVRGWLGMISALLSSLSLSNLQGNVPGGYTITTSVVVAVDLSVSVWHWVLSESLSTMGENFWGSMIPAGTPLLLVPILVPIEAVSFVARAFSLGVRLFSNMLAGHTLLAILADFMLLGLSSNLAVAAVTVVMLGLFNALVLLEMAVSLIQSYVFTVLTVSYLEGSANEPEAYHPAA